jgi:hypothetical protein
MENKNSECVAKAASQASFWPDMKVSRTALWRKGNNGNTKLLQYRQKLRQQILNLLGNKCAKCGFSDPRALQIDHIEGGGYSKRQGISVDNQYRHIIKSKGEGYQLLCANCNQIKKHINREVRK